MKRLFGNVVLVLCSLLVSLSLANAAQLKEARVTQVVKDVKLLPQQAPPRPATLSALVREGTAVRTGPQSRSELTFNDLTITRLGANTIFSFDEGTRMMDLRDGAILFQVPKDSGGATIRTAAVTAAITGTTGIGEFHPATAGNSQPFSKWLCLEGTFRLILPNGQSVELGPGKMVATNGENFSKVMSFDIGQVMKTALLVIGYDTPLASLPLIQIEQEKQLGSLIARTPITNISSLFDPTDIIDLVDQGMAAQQSPTVTPTPSITPTPSTPTPTPGKFGRPTVIASSDPYIIDSDTLIQTDPTITRNGVTDFGKIWRGPTEDGPLSAFIFGATSAFDTASGFDTEINGDMGGAGFKFSSLQLTGDPMISTTNGEINLGLIAVNGITSGEPGGVLSFAGIRGLLLATQNGPINLGPEISFAGLHNITFYARGSGSMLTLASDISTTNKIRLYAEGGIQLSSDLSTEDLIAFTNGDFDFTAGSIDAETISIFADGGVNFSLGTPLTFETTNFRLETNGDIEVNDSLEVTQTNIDQTEGLNIFFLGNGATHIGGDLRLTTDASNITNGGNIRMVGEFHTTIDSTLFLRTFARTGTTTGTGGNIAVNIQDFLTVGELAFTVDHSVPDVTVGNGANIRLIVVDSLNTTGSGSVNATIDNSGGGDSIGTGGNIEFFFGLDASCGALTLLVDNSNGGHIGTGGNISFTTGGNLTADSVDALINNRDGGSIDSGGNITFDIGGALTTTGDASVTTKRGAIFEILNTGGFIGGGADITVSAASLAADSLLARIDNSGKSSIGGNATINMNIAGSAAVTNDATVEILGSDGTASAAININEGDFDAGGTFRVFIDGDGTIALNNANVHADVLKVGALGANGVLNIGGGTLSADTTLKLYASGSNGQLNFISNVTLDGNSAKILAANSVTIFDDVVVTIGGENPADVYTNNANYSEEFGGNDSTTGTFAGAGANQPQPLPSAPPFDDARPSPTHRPTRANAHHSTHSGPKVASTGRGGGDFKASGRSAPNRVVKVSDSGQLLSLVNGTALGPDGTITIPNSSGTNNSRKSGQAGVTGRSNTDRPSANTVSAASRLP